KTFVSYLFFFGIGGFLHFKYYVGKKDTPEEWKCQPNKWLSAKEEIHEIIVGLFSLTIGSILSSFLATWVMNGGYTTIYYEFGKYGYLWSILELPIAFLSTDYITYWYHRVYHMPFLYKHFHKLHHTYKQPTAFSVTAIHPVEFLSIQGIYIMPMFVIPIHAAVYCGMLGYIYYHGIIDHSGITFKRLWFQPWQPDCIFHDNHHQYFHVNFGFNVELWDKLHGTARQKDKIYREDIFYGTGKDISEATREELMEDVREREDENPLAYQNNKHKFI
ncbi:lathosterol oxidase, partial [Eurytemora carolleeae]|uniref:lathosterol oxidase n=1 Tax=Eurytemora carolleeae TaxID=1294199 RepID=UPI000C767DD8